MKITQIEEIARPIGLKPRIKPLRASWNANLRNAVFHSNYAIIGSDLYLPEEHQTISVEDAMKRANRALAAFEAFVTILDLNRSHYTEPVEVETTLSWARTPGEKATVVVRAGYGAVAVHDTVDDCGVKSPVILGRMTAEELDLVRKGIFLLPAADKSW
ncbi:MAG TPA: hypothetical protein VMA98_11325 [Candidatus Acidoferrales bacterium]|nr:hypothetical protein [Candidatus Acidoferrales bacterium]